MDPQTGSAKIRKIEIDASRLSGLQAVQELRKDACFCETQIYIFRVYSQNVSPISGIFKFRVSKKKLLLAFYSD